MPAYAGFVFAVKTKTTDAEPEQEIRCAVDGRPLPAVAALLATPFRAEAERLEQLLSVKDLCALFGVSRDWAYKHSRSNATDPLPCVRLGRLLRFSAQKVRQYLESRRNLDSGGSLQATDGIARVNGRRYRAMARKRFQAGHVRLRGKRNPYWEGFYREDVLLPDGRVVRKQRTKNLGRRADIPTKRLAQRRLTDIVKELNDEDYRPRPVVTVRDFVEQKYLKLTMPTKKDTTRHGYEVILRKHVLPEIGDRQLTELTGEDIQELVNRKSASGLSWNTVRNIKWVLSAVFEAAVKHSYRKSNPARLADLPPEPVQELQPLASDDDLNRLEDSLGEPYRTLIWLERITGLRPSELFALRRSSLKRETRRIWVVTAINYGKPHSPKTHRSRRPIQLDEEQWERLEEFLRRHSGAKEDDWLFPNKRGTGPLRADNVLERVIRPKVKELSLPRITLHLLRHWNLTTMVEEGVPVKVAQERMGHSRSDTTMKHYLHVSDEAHTEAAQAISRRLKTSRKDHELRKLVSDSVSELEVVGA